MNCGSMRLNFERSSPDAGCCRPIAKMRDPMDRSHRLTDGTRLWIFMRLLQLDSLMTSYTDARPEDGLFVPLPSPSRQLDAVGDNGLIQARLGRDGRYVRFG